MPVLELDAASLDDALAVVVEPTPLVDAFVVDATDVVVMELDIVVVPLPDPPDPPTTPSPSAQDVAPKEETTRPPTVNKPTPSTRFDGIEEMLAERPLGRNMKAQPSRIRSDPRTRSRPASASPRNAIGAFDANKIQPAPVSTTHCRV